MSLVDIYLYCVMFYNLYIKCLFLTVHLVLKKYIRQRESSVIYCEKPLLVKFSFSCKSIPYNWPLLSTPYTDAIEQVSAGPDYGEITFPGPSTSRGMFEVFTAHPSCPGPLKSRTIKIVCCGAQYFLVMPPAVTIYTGSVYTAYPWDPHLSLVLWPYPPEKRWPHMHVALSIDV